MPGPVPLASVIIPVHNGEKYIGEAIDSVLAQSMRDFELIVIDDGSTDRTAELVSEIQDERLRLYRGPKRGVSAALNEGLHRSKAEFVARLDADDIMEPRRLERQLAFLRDRPALGGAASYFTLIDEAGGVRGRYRPPLLSLNDVELQLATGGQLIYPHPTVMLRRQAALAVGGYDSAFDGCEDVDLFLRMYEAGWPLLVQPEMLTRFRIHTESTSARHIRAQHFLNETIFGNFRRRRKGGLSRPLDWYVERGSRTVWGRLTAERRILSTRLRRASLVAQMRGRRCTAIATLAVAGLLHPSRAVGAAVRATIRRSAGAREEHWDPGLES